MESIESSIKFIPYAQELVYIKLSNLTYLGKILNELPLADLNKKGVKVDPSKIYLERDSVTIPISGINLCIRIINREPCKTIKFEFAGIPVDASMWIQILPVTDMEESKIKVTLHYDIPFYLKALMKEKLKNLPDLVEKLANLLSGIQY